MNKHLISATLMAGALIMSLGQPAYSEVPFYEGKTITIVQGRGAGGTGDLRVKIIATFLRKYIPGHPTIVVQYMPGAGGRRAANYVSKVAKPDGLTIGNVGGGLLANAILGAQGVQYNVDDLIYLGGTDSRGNEVFFTYQGRGLDTLEKIKAAKTINIGVQSVGDDIYIKSRLFAYLIGLKVPQFIAGYEGGQRYLALERGEIDALTVTAQPLLRDKPDWLEKHTIYPISVLATPQDDIDPHFSHLPELETFARSDLERKVLALDRGMRAFGSPYFFPPHTPSGEVDILRKAMQLTFNDVGFQEEFKRGTQEDPSSITFDAMDNLLHHLPRDAEVISLMREIAGSDSLPAR